MSKRILLIAGILAATVASCKKESKPTHASAGSGPYHGLEPAELSRVFLERFINDSEKALPLMTEDLQAETTPQRFASLAKNMLPVWATKARIELANVVPEGDWTDSTGQVIPVSEYHYKLVSADGKHTQIVEVHIIRQAGRVFVERLAMPGS